MNIYKNDNLDFLINYFLHKVIFGSNQDMVNIYTDKDTYYVNESFYLYIDVSNIKYNNINYVGHVEKIELPSNIWTKKNSFQYRGRFMASQGRDYCIRTNYRRTGRTGLFFST